MQCKHVFFSLISPLRFVRSGVRSCYHFTEGGRADDSIVLLSLGGGDQGFGVWERAMNVYMFSGGSFRGM